MLNKFRTAVSSVMGGISPLQDRPEGVFQEGGAEGRKPQINHAYNRPVFLQLTQDEVQVSADHITRPILVPRDVSRLPWNAGYAE